MTDAPTPENGFAIGEVAELVYSRYHSNIHSRGDEVVIIEGLHTKLDYRANVVRQAYKIEHRDGSRFCVTPDQLRKKRPPSDDLKTVHWDECPWQPESINV